MSPNDFPCTVFDTGTLGAFKGAVKHWWFPRVCFCPFSVEHVLAGLRKQFITNFVFPAWACAADFNDDNNNKSKVMRRGAGGMEMLIECM